VHGVGGKGNMGIKIVGKIPTGYNQSIQKDMQYNYHIDWSGIETGPLWLRGRRLIA
jgi:hypothetical protein